MAAIDGDQGAVAVILDLVNSSPLRSEDNLSERLCATIAKSSVTGQSFNVTNACLRDTSRFCLDLVTLPLLSLTAC